MLFGLFLHLTAPALHSSRLSLQELQEPVTVPPARRRTRGGRQRLGGASVPRPVPALQPGVGRREGGRVEGRIQTLGEGRRAALRGRAIGQDLSGGAAGRHRDIVVMVTVVEGELGRRVHRLAGAVDHDFLLGVFGVGRERQRREREILRVGVRLLPRGHTTGAAETNTHIYRETGVR